MTDANMARHRASVHYPFWRVLKQGYDAFEATGAPPNVVVCEKRYLINPRWRGAAPTVIEPRDRCPRHNVVPAAAFSDAAASRVGAEPHAIEAVLRP
jgi:murein L,D-transpeptidase YafK